MAASDRRLPVGASCCRSRRRFQSDRAAATRAGAAGSGSVSINAPRLSHRRPRRKRQNNAPCPGVRRSPASAIRRSNPRTPRAASNRTLFSFRLRIRLWMCGSDTAAKLHCEQRTRCRRRSSLPALTHACSIRKNEKARKQQTLRPLFVARRSKSSTEIAISVSSLNGCKPDPWPSVVH